MQLDIEYHHGTRSGGRRMHVVVRISQRVMDHTIAPHAGQYQRARMARILDDDDDVQQSAIRTHARTHGE